MSTPCFTKSIKPTNIHISLKKIHKHNIPHMHTCACTHVCAHTQNMWEHRERIAMGGGGLGKKRQNLKSAGVLFVKVSLTQF